MTDETQFEYARDHAEKLLEEREREIRSLRRDLARTIEFFAFHAGLPKHTSSCSNQNVLDPVGAYLGVKKCGCTQGVWVENEVSLPEASAEWPTVDALVAYIETLFDCRDGFYGPFALQRQAGREDYLYRTLTIIADDKTPDPQQRLRNALAHDFLTLRASLPQEPKPILYWRYRKDERIQEEEASGAIGYETRYKIRTRIAIPGVDWSVVEVQREGESARKI